MTILIVLLIVGWVAVALLGSQAYFRGEQSKPIHERNWGSESFDQLSQVITGAEVDYSNRAFVYSGDAYISRNLSNR